MRLVVAVAALAGAPLDAQSGPHPGDALAVVAPSAAGIDPPVDNASGLRQRLADAGLMFNLVYTSDLMSSVRGGARSGAAHIHNVDLALFLDGGSLLGWRGTYAYVYMLGNWGESLSHYTGDFQGVSNIEAPHAVRLFEAWVRKDLLDGRLSLQAGLLDLNSEFYVTESSSLFVHSSHGIGPEFSQTGQAGPSIFPSTSLALRVQAAPVPGLTVRTAVFDAVPGDPDHLSATRIRLSRGEGALLTGEVELAGGGPDLAFGLPIRMVAGAWTYTGGFESVDGSAGPTQGNRGAYGIVEGIVVSPRGAPDRGLRAFGRVGVANPRFNQVAWSWGAGLVYRGPLPTRPFDEVGVAVAEARNGRVHLEHARRTTGPVATSETAVEVSYAAVLAPWLRVQPDLQFVVRPDMDLDTRDALVAGLRASVAF